MSPKSEHAAPTRRWTHAAALIFLIVAASVVYLNGGHPQFFFDSIRITQDPVNSHLGDAVRQCLRSGLRPNQDLSRISFAANYEWNIRHGVDGFDPTSYLVVNVALHAAATCMIYLVGVALLRWTGCTHWGAWACFLAALLFAVHPIQVTSVVYIVQRRGILTTLFYLISVWACIRAFDSGGGRRMAWCCLTALCGYLTIKSKSMGLTLPIALWFLYLVHTFTIKGRLPRSVVAVSLLIIAFTLLFGYLVIHGSLRLQAPMATSVGPLDQFMTQLRVMAATLGLVVLPVAPFLSIDHLFNISRGPDLAVVASAILHVCIIWYAIRSIRRRRPATGFGLLLFYISYIPWLAVPQNEQFVEYKAYLGMAGLAVTIASELSRLQGRITRVLATVLFLAGSAALASGTVHRNEIFKDPITIWTDVLKKSPAHFRARVSLGFSLAQNRRYVEALREYQQAAAIDPYNATLHYYMGNSLREMGKLREAVAEYREGLRIAGGDLHIAINLGNSLASLGETDEAIRVYRSGLAEAASGTDAATLAQAHVALGNALGGQRKSEEAAREFRAAIEASPTYAKAYYGLAVVLDQLGRRDEAIDNLYITLRLDPGMKLAEVMLRDILGKKATGQ
ncbi:MAG TPA: tetratricopeptide repeat protein [Phycisphaerae bacterium]|nr:tetratricopeptide repeat protein [Phycisphaerae bacterium]